MLPDRRWCCWMVVAVVVLSVVGVLYYRTQAVENEARAERQEELFEQKRVEADSLEDLAAGRGAALDSTRAENRRLQEQNDLLRDSIRREVSEAEERGEVAQAGFYGHRSRLDARLDTIRAQVPPRWRPVVDRARADVDSMTVTHRRFARAQQAIVELERQATRSWREDALRYRTEADSAHRQNDRLEGVVASKNAALEEAEVAVARWKDAASRSPLEILTGDGILEGATNLALGIAVCSQDAWGCAGWGGENVRRIIVHR